MDRRATGPVTGDGEKPGALRQRDVRRRFEVAAASFDDADFVHRHAARGIVERCSPMLVDVHRVLDAGAGPGRASRELAKLYHRSQVVSIDQSVAMLRRAKKGRSRFARVSEVQADAVALPLQPGCIDLVFANLLLPWVADIGQFFSAVDRVLRKEGLFVFSSLGPDSLSELRQAWAGVDDGEHVNTFIDMHDIGDALLKCGLRGPVLDVDYLTVTYRDADALISDLSLAGGRNCLSRRRRTLTGKNRFARMKQALNASRSEGVLACRLELIYGHAWGGGPRESPGEFRVDASSVSRRRR